MAKLAVSAAKKARQSNLIMVEAYNVRVRLVPVTSSMIDDMMSAIVEPEIPMYHNEAQQRDEPNPTDPAYLKAVEAYDKARGTVMIEGMVMFGLDLVDGLPEQENWLTKLKLMEKRGLISLAEYNLEDAVDKEYLFKRYVIATNDVIAAVGELSGVSGEELKTAEKSFRRIEEG